MIGFKNYNFAKRNGYKGTYESYRQNTWRAYRMKMNTLGIKPMDKVDFFERFTMCGA
jgi:hypothetical protein